MLSFSSFVIVILIFVFRDLRLAFLCLFHLRVVLFGSSAERTQREKGWRGEKRTKERDIRRDLKHQ